MRFGEFVAIDELLASSMSLVICDSSLCGSADMGSSLQVSRGRKPATDAVQPNEYLSAPMNQEGGGKFSTDICSKYVTYAVDTKRRYGVGVVSYAVCLILTFAGPYLLPTLQSLNFGHIRLQKGNFSWVKL